MESSCQRDNSQVLFQVTDVKDSFPHLMVAWRIVLGCIHFCPGELLVLTPDELCSTYPACSQGLKPSFQEHHNHLSKSKHKAQFHKSLWFVIHSGATMFKNTIPTQPHVIPVLSILLISFVIIINILYTLRGKKAKKSDLSKFLLNRPIKFFNL